MKEIANAENKLRNDPKKREAYKKYQKYEAMLQVYNKMGSVNLVKSSNKPFSQVGKWIEDSGLDKDKDYDALLEFIEIADKLKKRKPQMQLNDLTSEKGREVIAKIISRTQRDSKFDESDLHVVAIAKCYGLYEIMDQAEGKSVKEITMMLIKNQVTIGTYQEACRKKDLYEKNNRRELYDRNRQPKSDNMVHMAAAALELSPGEVENALIVFDKVEGKRYENEFDKNIRIKEEEVSRAVLDTIIMDDRFTDEQKAALIDREYAKVTESNKFIKGLVQQWIDHGRDAKDMTEDFKKRHGIVILNEKEDQDREEIG